ncbi:hypothetical protein HanXRQr2_Chr12g0553171 [Helianthus annuus]|uniref:Uncharacterized protein n=1 Tax=Helianthus annuus TaxID=4232 RepID=A0A9K3MX20_HELAN|nr:hypothetical protein HanXRQr2_Chr12g0553171 [Helianthus annuus]
MVENYVIRKILHFTFFHHFKTIKAKTIQLLHSFFPIDQTKKSTIFIILNLKHKEILLIWRKIDDSKRVQDLKKH